jgi:hypothetical protein
MRDPLVSALASLAVMGLGDGSISAHLKRVKEQGSAARIGGLLRGDNPYAACRQDWRYWDAGWVKANREAKEELGNA